MLAIFPLADWLSLSGELQGIVAPEDEQINKPEISDHYWRYRMPISIESLSEDYRELNESIASLIRTSGRG